MRGAPDPYPPSTGQSNILIDQMHVTPPSPVSPVRGDSEHSVLRRLSTLFSSDAAEQDQGASGFSMFSGMSGTDAAPAPPVKDRNAIKVLVVTWNMGDALPKGDLSVLLGKVPKYEPRPGEGLPQFDLVEGHPYHVVVVAAQECPTPSGMPRGLGGTLMKGVGLQKSEAYKRDKEERDKEKAEKDVKEAKEAKESKKEEKAARKEARKAEKNGQADKGDLDADLSDSSDVSGDEDLTSPLSPLESDKLTNGHSNVKQKSLPIPAADESSTTDENGSAVRKRANTETAMSSSVETRNRTTSTSTSAVAHGTLSVQKVGPRGWSAMLDDWLCNGPVIRRSNVTSPPGPTTAAFERTDYPSRSSAPTAKPAPIPTTATKPMAIPTKPSLNLQVPATSSVPHGRSPLGQSHETGSLLAHSEMSSPSLVRTPSDRVLNRPLWDEYRPCREPGTGPYVNVAKERLLGLYTSVFVYRGCEHLVQGVDKDFVTTGLAGGRFGNKGGIGISLNLAGHRLLFVNAHLAAHAERQDARLANIAKIKQELNLDCFLPPDDPRATMEDITERYDTTFWCGDLNFRVDISIVHAKWLLEQKKYQEALTFDQLRKVMSDPKLNPLPGFHEADITFMPTFKYDVWKSVRATNRELRRSIRQRRKTMEKQERPSLEDKGTPNHHALDFVPEVDGLEEHAAESSEPPDSPEPRRPNVIGSPTLPEIPIDDSRSIRSARSTRTARSDVSSLRPDVLGKPVLELERGRAADNARVRRDPSLSRSPAAGPRSPSVPRSSTDWSRPSRDLTRPSMESTITRPVLSLRQKTKKLMGILSLGRKPHVRPHPGSDRLDDDNSRRHSMSSHRSFASELSGATEEDPSSPAISVPAPEPRADRVEDTPDVFADDKGRRPSVSTIASHRVVSPPTRAKPSIRRSVSGHSMREEDLDEDFDDAVDHRVGVYDTSKKARVPSWCDRVLWKSQIIPDEDMVEEPDDAALEPRAPFSRLSNALSNIGGHFRRRSTTYVDQPQPLGLPTTPPPKAIANGMSNSSSVPVGLGEGIAPGELTPVFDSEPATPVNGAMEFPLASNEEIDPLTTPSSPVMTTSTPKRMRERSVTFHGSADTNANPFLERRATSASVESPTRRESLRRQASVSLARRGSATLRRRSADPACSPSTSTSALALKPVKTTGHSIEEARRRVNSTSAGDGLGGAIGRFLRDLPGRFHSRVSIVHPDVEEHVDNGPRRHLAGEVEVLHYGTIDDAGMRQLEGRSDHRPAIFAAAVYV